MRYLKIVLPLVMALVLLPHNEVEARTWRVELNGTGDFTDIQPAVNASADGDTILIGGGRFDQLHPCVAPAWTEDAIVAVVQDNLTFIGSGTNQTVIGMRDFYGSEFDAPKGFCSVDAYSGTIVEPIDGAHRSGEMKIYDLQGRLVYRKAIGKAAKGRVVWGGRTNSGAILPSSKYVVVFQDGNSGRTAQSSVILVK